MYVFLLATLCACSSRCGTLATLGNGNDNGTSSEAVVTVTAEAEAGAEAEAAAVTSAVKVPGAHARKTIMMDKLRLVPRA